MFEAGNSGKVFGTMESVLVSDFSCACSLSCLLFCFFERPFGKKFLLWIFSKNAASHRCHLRHLSFFQELLDLNKVVSLQTGAGVSVNMRYCCMKQRCSVCAWICPVHLLVIAWQDMESLSSLSDPPLPPKKPLTSIQPQKTPNHTKTKHCFVSSDTTAPVISCGPPALPFFSSFQKGFFLLSSWKTRINLVLETPFIVPSRGNSGTHFSWSLRVWHCSNYLIINLKP